MKYQSPLEMLQPMAKPLSEYRRGEMAIEILKYVAIGGIVISVLALPGLAAVFSIFEPRNAVERRRVHRATRALARDGYIQKGTRSGRYMLTAKGKRKLTERSFYELTITKPKQWDGKWRMVMFDIPHKRERERKMLRLKLKELGFYPYQKSVFVYPYDCREEILFMKKFLHLDSQILMGVITELDGEGKIKQHFKI